MLHVVENSLKSVKSPIAGHTLGHPSAADEAWYWPKCVLRSG